MSEREQRALLKLIAERIGISVDDITRWLEEQNSLAAIEERILRNDYTNAIVGVQDAAAKLAADIQSQYVAAASKTTEFMDARVPDRLVRFDTASPEVVARARTNQLELVQGFQQEQWQVVRQITQRAIEESATLGTNPRRVAQDFRTSIGLTAQQEQWVASYRRQLESGDYLGATQRELSSGHADRTLRSYDAKDKALTPQQIDDYVARYRENALTYRAETIARTEALRNAHEGADDAMRQAVARGDVEAEQLDVEWHAGPATPGSRADHQAMDGVKVPFGEDFVLPDGTRMSGPGDPRGGAEHCANCRCTKSVAMTSIPKGFTAAGRKIEDGVPKRGDIDETKAYVISPSDISSRLVALPGAGSDANRLGSVRTAQESGVRLPPVKLVMGDDGTLYVSDGRHRLLTAAEAGRDVLAVIERGYPGADLRTGTVPLLGE